MSKHSPSVIQCPVTLRVDKDAALIAALQTFRDRYHISMSRAVREALYWAMLQKAAPLPAASSVHKLEDGSVAYVGPLDGAFHVELEHSSNGSAPSPAPAPRQESPTAYEPWDDATDNIRASRRF